MLIDRSYFFGELLIPNANTDGSPVVDVVDSFIQKYEPRFLRYALGFELYQVVKPALDALANSGTALPQRFTDLIYGVDYFDAGQRGYRWRGLIENAPGQPGVPQSIIANYVYYWYMRDNALQTLSSGVGVSTSENVTMVNPGEKMTRAMSELWQTIKEMVHFMNYQRGVYPEWNSQRLYVLRNSFSSVNDFGI